MLRKAAEEDIVVNYTNLYDHFFESTGECRAKVTATRLPYFDGDHWPRVAEVFIPELQTASKDEVLMLKLGNTIVWAKQNFIMVHLQHACSHCCILMVSGNRWVCNQSKNFQICDKCYEAEKNREERERHPKDQRESHALNRIEITDVPADTEDQDEILESEFFDTRVAFLSFCQENGYQFDSLRRAKYSSILILHHLHNPTDPAVVTTCDMCKLRLETDQGWGCECCPNYDVCNACYQKGVIDHPHQLTRQNRGLKLKKMLDLLAHCSTCPAPENLCQLNCQKMKAMFLHAAKSKLRVAGSCPFCDNMKTLLLVHAKYCEESQCLVPRCRQIRYQLRSEHHQADSLQRAAATISMRERAPEAAANNEMMFVEQTKGINGLDKIVLREVSGFSAEVYLYGGQVTSWKTNRGEELLFTSKKTEFKPPKPIRGGIQLCFPEFTFQNNERYGFARNKMWSVDQSPQLPTDSTHKASNDLILNLSEEEQQIFPHKFEFRLRVTLRPDGALTLIARIRNIDGTKLSFSFAYNAHFRVSDVGEVRIEGFETHGYLDNLKNKERFTEQGDALTFKGEEYGIHGTRKLRPYQILGMMSIYK